MKKIIIIILLTFIVSITFAQQYTPMTAAGYQMKRLKVDSTLHIPSFCGVPTTRNSTAKEGAIAMDTCNNLLYKWTNASGWSTISGGGGSLGINGLSGTDSIKLGGSLIENTTITGKYNFNMNGLNSMDFKADGKGELYIDSTLVGIDGDYIQIETDSTDITSTDTSFYKPLAIGISNKVRRMASWPKTDTASLSNRINLKLNISDTSAMLSKYLRKTDTASLSSRINLKLNLSDTATMLSKYLRKTDTASLSSRINLKLNLSDTATMLSKYLRKTDTASLSSRINLKLNISDTSAMLSKYLRKTDTASLSARINTKLAIADTVNKWVQDVTKLNDSTIRVRKNNTNTDIILPKGTGGGGGTFTSPNLQQVLDSGNVADYKSLIIAGGFTPDSVFLIPGSADGLTEQAKVKVSWHGVGDPESYIKMGVLDDSLNQKPYIDAYLMNTIGYANGFKLNSDELYWKSDESGTGNLIFRGSSGNYHLPITNYPQTNDTLATLQDLRLGGGGSGTVYVDSIYRTVGKDSIFYKKNGNTYAIKDSVGTTTGFVPYTGATTDVDLGTHILNAQSIGVKGTNGNGHIDLRHQATNAPSTGQTTALFADANGDIKWKNAGNYYTTLKSSGNAADAIYTYPSATTTLIGAADTSVFQRKSIAAYSFMANNTASTANATPLVYKDAGEQAYTGTITWTFTSSAPSGATTFYYRWSQIGKTVNYNFYFYYATASVASSAVTFDLPTDMPTPQQPTGSLGTGSFLYKSNNVMQLNQTAALSYTSGGLRKTATGYEWNLTSTASTRFVEVTGFYFVN